MTRSLAVDLGGTHVRFRLVEDEDDARRRPAPVHVVETRGVASFEAALGQWRERAGIYGRLDAVAVAAAGPVSGDRVRITNLGWTLDAREIERSLGAGRCLLVNDVTAIAWALPRLGKGDVRELGAGDSDDRVAGMGGGSGTSDPGGCDQGEGHGYGADVPGMAAGMHRFGTDIPDDLAAGNAHGSGTGDPDGLSVESRRGLDTSNSHGRPAGGGHGLGAGCPGSLAAGDVHGPGTYGSGIRAARAVIAPGTGLGVSGLVPVGAVGFAAVEGEGGHRTLAAQSPREWAIVNALAERFGHASAERALSGPGIEALYRAVASIDGVPEGRDRTAAEIAHDAFTRSDPIAEEAIATFTGFLGSVAGDLALTLGARGGVYLAGGIVPEWGGRFDAARFLDRFRAKGRFRDYLSAVPVHVVTHPHPALAGTEHLLAQRPAGAS